MDSLPTTTLHFIGLTADVISMFTLAYLLTVDAIIEGLGLTQAIGDGADVCGLTDRVIKQIRGSKLA